MNPQTLARLLWQLPVLAWLVILLLPGVPWHSAWFGPWPLWLSASPALLLAFGRRRAARTNSPRRALSGAQVLVFPIANRGGGVVKPVQKRAA